MKNAVHRHNPIIYGGIMPVQPDDWVEVSTDNREWSQPVQAKDRYWGIGMDVEFPIYFYRRVDAPVQEVPGPGGLVDTLSAKFRERIGSYHLATLPNDFTDRLAEETIDIVRNFLASKQG